MPAIGHRPQGKTYTNSLLSNMYYEQVIATKLRSHTLKLVNVAVLAFSAYHWENAKSGLSMHFPQRIQLATVLQGTLCWVKQPGYS